MDPNLFYVAVISKDRDQVKDMLAPYQRNEKGNCPKEFLEFFEVEGEYLEKYQNDTTTMVLTPNRRLIPLWDEELIALRSFGPFRKDLNKLPEGYLKVKVKFSQLYPTFEDYMRSENIKYGLRGRDPEKRKYGYWENPNARWSSWEFEPLLRLKKRGREGSNGEN